MITYKNLENTSIDEILEAFNSAFSEYMIPLKLTKELLQWKLKSENFSPKYSVGAFHDNQLVGFILHCTDPGYLPNTVYNGGTGVMKQHRGQSITRKMYEYILPILRNDGIHKVILEVIEGNLPAHQTYLKIGFEEERKLQSFKGKPVLNQKTNLFHIKPTEDLDILNKHNFGSTQPSWQNSTTSLLRVHESLITLQAERGNEIVGYVVYNPQLKRVHQIAVHPHYQRQGCAQELLEYIMTHFNEEINIINIDEKDVISTQFFLNRKLENHVNLFEMSLSI